MAFKKVAAAAAPKSVLVNFGSLSDYSAGGALPEGDYLASDFSVVMHQLEKKDGTKVGQPGLFVRVTFEPPVGAEKEEEQHIQYYSMGKAHESYAPDPDTGKGLVAIAGGKGSSLNDQTNWAVFLKSLYDCGLPEGVFVNDMTVLDGMQVHISNVPEPEGRKQMKALTGEVAAEARGPKTIAVVTEIKDGGAPWEGGGGPIAKAAAVAAKPGLKKTAAAAPAVAPKPALVKKPVAPAPPAEEDDGAEAVAAFISAISSVIEKTPKGLPRMQLRTKVLPILVEASDADTAAALVEAYFADNAALTAVLNEINYTLSGTNVIPLG